ncbi:OLC1v1007445C1 [Oldenlandia corymbosa var. corymbosa]|uniref:OLC1v1007445C1 n=1 Tax=Oldenlandia corymbosa var. corymbosa TaxID=529605 RepID=A0AAV1DLW6_OLDCO|nr:OLC1v1007445C1 [Oldenlandia corymbosa var. corymbosa]
MDKLVKPDLQELCICFNRGQKCSATFKLTNVMHTMSVAVSLTSTNSSLFSFSHPFSIIPPQSTSTYTLFLNQNNDSDDQPPLCSPLDTVIVRSSMLPIGKANQDHLRRLFSKPGPHIFKDAFLPISFVGPQVVESLILSPGAKSLEVAFLLSKALFWCDKGQLDSLLMCAAKSPDNSSFVSAMIDAGADVNYRDPETKQSAMTLSVESGNIDAVQALIQAGYELDCSVDLFLHDAAAMERLDLLEILCLGYPDLDLDLVDSKGRTALHMAAIQGNLSMIRFLVSSGSDPDVVDCRGWTPLHYATEEGHVQVVEYLLNHSISAKYTISRDGKTAYDIALEEGHSQLYNMLYLGDVLHSAARRGDIESIQACLAESGGVANVDLNSRDQNGWTPLHRAAFKGKIECVKMLVSHGAQLDIVDEIGYSPIHLAVEAGHMKIATYLLAHGAKSNLKSLKSVASDGKMDCFQNHPFLLNQYYQEKEIA